MGCPKQPSARPGESNARMDAPPDRPANEEPSSAPPSDATGNPLPPDVPAGPPPEAPPRRGVSWLGIAVAGIGVILAVLGVASLLISRDSDVSALDARLAGVELDLRDLAARARPPAADPKALDAVAGRVAKLEAAAGAAPPPSASDGALAARVAALETQIKTLAETVGALGRRNDEALDAAREARVRADAGAAEISELAQKPPGAVDRSEFEALANRTAAVERSEKAAKSAGESADRAVRLALAATALNAAVERGDAFAAELATVKALGADPKLVAALEPFARAGVPSAAALARQFSELAPALQAAGAPPPEGVLGRLQMNAEKLVRIRRVDEAPGSDADAIVVRSEAKAARGDLAGVAAELAQLAPNARVPAEAWIKSVQARAAAIDASRRLAADALAGLGK